MDKFDKQPAEILDYDYDFSPWLASKPSAVPVSHAVLSDTGITVISAVRTGAVVKITLAGGTSGVKYKVTVRLTTDTGLVRELEALIAVKEI